MSVKTYPYQNLSLSDIKGETWDDVPGYEGEYQVSNFGRIKSLRRWRNSGKNAGYYTKELIRKPMVRSNYNKHIDQNTYLVSITLKSKGKNYTTAIARYVYYVFVKPFEINNPDIIVSYKDYNGRNVKPENLYLTNRNELVRKSYESGRSYSDWAKNKLSVLQRNMKGHVVAKFDSISQASQSTGFSLSAIAECMKGNIHQHKGFQWRNADKKDLENNRRTGDDLIFNEYLWKKIGSPRTSKKNPLPALSLSLKTLKGEQWKFIEGLNNSYQISNFGRVKSVARFKHNYFVWTKDHIQRLIPDVKKNRNGATLFVQLTKNGRKYQQSVARLVYFHFVKKFNLNDKASKVGFKDDCFYNLRYNNLYLRNKLKSRLLVG